MLRRPCAVEGTQSEWRFCLSLWPLGLIAVLVAVLVWSNGGPVIASAFQSPSSPLDVPLPESLPVITTSPTASVSLPGQGPMLSNPTARLFLWIGIGLLMVSAITGAMLIWQRRKG